MKTIFVVMLFWSFCAQAQNLTASVVAIQGSVQILSEKGDGDKIKFEEKSYHARRARIGDKLAPKDVVLTGNNSQLKGVYTSGDQFFVGPASALVMPYPRGSTEEKGVNVDLIYGKVRSLVTKTGPLHNMNMKTKSAVAGVRGTDFYVSEIGESGTDVVVLRGEVAVKPVDAKAQTPPTMVKPGYMAVVAPDAIAQTPVAVNQASKEKLLEVQSASNVKLKEDQVKALPAPMQKEVQDLEKKSTNVIMAEIKTSTPALYEEIQKKSPGDVTAINTAVVARLYKQAPTEKPKTKPSEKDIDSIGKDVYDKYFKPED